MYFDPQKFQSAKYISGTTLDQGLIRMKRDGVTGDNQLLYVRKTEKSDFSCGRKY